MKALYTTVLAAGLAGCATHHSQTPWSTNTAPAAAASPASSARDGEFARAARQAAAAKIELGILAGRNSRNPEVRKLARRLIEEHSAATRDLAKLCSRKGIRAERGLPYDAQLLLDKLGTLSGGDFDRAFKEQAVKRHETAIELFEKHRTEGSDADLKAFAERYLPALCEHLAVARGLETGEEAQHTRSTWSSAGSGTVAR